MLRVLCTIQCRRVRRQAMTHAEQTERTASMMHVFQPNYCVAVLSRLAAQVVDMSLAVLPLSNVASVMEQQQSMRTCPMRTATRLRDKVCMRQLLAS